MNNETKHNWLTTVLKEHPALLASVIYFSASAIGMFYSWAFLRHFGVNVFNFAQIGDFLLASLKEPMTWVLVIVAIVLMVADNAWSRRRQKKGTSRWFRWYGTDTYRTANYVALVGMICMFLFLFAGEKAEEVKSGEGDYVKVMLADGIVPRNAMLLGTTGQFIFLYDAETGAVDIHPNENVQTISLPGSD